MFTHIIFLLLFKIHKLQKPRVDHKILSTILSRYVNTQHIGLIWNLKNHNNITDQIHLVFHLALCILDLKGVHQLCGMYVVHAQAAIVVNIILIIPMNNESMLHHDMYSYIMTKTIKDLQEYN